MKLFVYHTPELTPTDARPDCAVVIDVLRATTTIATALHNGAEAVQAFSDIQKLLHVSEQWPAEKRLRAGERGGKPVEGCDMGNSPLFCTAERVAGRRLFLSTTNGTRALKRVETAPIVITAAQVNRQVAVDFLQAQQPETVWLVGSGWEGAYSLEDTACAGAIALLCYQRDPNCLGNDETLGAIALYQQWQQDLVGLFQRASHGQRMLRLGLDADLSYCANTDSLDALPLQTDLGVLQLAKV
ncbi:MAG: 2-phosphosulfolactate phosphatase family protein [Spirulinaceae cyanobacterium RM2_2_10]|nr:2-phosphosulfolactate phosphatase family protein [Spirulinaceae cyanobacterium SM2_1_0]NJO20733.1 2-phosphosulfolactate phosphatase family protein [Spirulinaceae cyanobacterium RM2_2_10]